MKPKTQKQKERELRLHNMLKDLYQLTLKPRSAKDLQFDALAKKHGVNKSIKTTLSKSGIISIDVRSIQSMYTWKAEKPTPNTARWVLKKHTEFNKKYTPSIVKDVEKNTTTFTKEQQVISIFKKQGQSFKQIAKSVERPESEVRELYFDTVLKSK